MSVSNILCPTLRVCMTHDTFLDCPLGYLMKNMDCPLEFLSAPCCMDLAVSSTFDMDTETTRLVIAWWMWTKYILLNPMCILWNVRLPIGQSLAHISFQLPSWKILRECIPSIHPTYHKSNPVSDINLPNCQTSPSQIALHFINICLIIGLESSPSSMALYWGYRELNVHLSASQFQTDVEDGIVLSNLNEGLK